MVNNAVHPRVELAAHPLRELLNDEFHARPPLPLTSPVLVSHLVLTQDPAVLAGERNRLCRLAQTHAGKLLTSSDTCLVFDGGPFLLRWELHTEFSSYTVFRSLPPGEPRNAEATALDVLPTEWLRTLPGQMIVATHVELRSSGELSPESVTAGLTPTGRQMVAAQVADRAAWVFTDFIFDQGFSRFMVLDVSLTQRQAGRTVQRLLEIETYRLLALLALPVAKEVGGWLTGAEQQLAEMVDHIGQASSPGDEREVLADLTRLAAEVEHSVARTTFRFGAARAYHDLVMQRIDELREIRVVGCPTFHEIMQRRLLPAMHTCIAMANRQDDLSDRLARTSQLLRTRVDVELERQNQEQLTQMNRRARLQLRLQETVEGLSVVAITYYASQLVHYLAKGGKMLFPEISPEIAAAVSIPLIAGFLMLGIRRMRRRLRQAEDSEH
jgi:uncharacterized membrane-anchored protein